MGLTRFDTGQKLDKPMPEPISRDDIHTWITEDLSERIPNVPNLGIRTGLLCLLGGSLLGGGMMFLAFRFFGF